MKSRAKRAATAGAVGVAVCCALAGCQALKVAGDVLSAIAPTPQQQCQQSGGKWRVITTYGPNGNPHSHEECISQ